MFFKVFFKGRLDFGNVKSYETALKMYVHKTETLYKNDILLKAEDIFDEVQLCINLPRIQGNVLEKTWKNSVALLAYMAEFAIAGQIISWVSESTQELAVIIPNNEKEVNTDYQQAIEWLNDSEKENDAIELLKKVISKYEGHSWAYERLGYAYFLQNDLEGALNHYQKSLEYQPNFADALFGIARVQMLKAEYTKAIETLQQSTAKSVPKQSVYWSSRRVKGDCHINLKQYNEAANELKFYVKQKFNADHINLGWKKSALFNYATVLNELQDYKQAILILDEAIAIEDSIVTISDDAILALKGSIAAKVVPTTKSKADTKKASQKLSKVHA